MGTPKVGLNSFVGFVSQTGYSTRVLPTTKFLPLLEGGDDLTAGYERIETAGLDSIGFSSSRYRRGRENVSGSVTVEVLYEGLEVLLYHLFGQVTTSQPAPGDAPNVYNHTFVPATSLPTGLTLEIYRGDTSFFVTGAKVTSVEFSQGINAPMQATINFVGRVMATGTASTPSIPTANMFAAPDSRLKWNGTEQDVSNWTFSVTNNLDADRIFIGSRFIKEPVRNSRLEITGTFETEFQSLTLWNDFKAATQRELVIQSIGDTIEGGYFNEFNATFPLTILNAFPVKVDGAGPVKVTGEWKSYRSASQNEVTLVLRNTVTSVS